MEPVELQVTLSSERFAVTGSHNVISSAFYLNGYLFSLFNGDVDSSD
jgi:hypothetical protein